MEVGLGIAAGAGWGIAGGLAVALWVALRWRPQARPPAHGKTGDVLDYSGFGEKHAAGGR